MNVLVINLTRFGDLLQMQPVILGLKAQGHRVGLLCLDNFAAAAALLDGVDHVAPLPGGLVLARLDTDWRLALHILDSVLTDLRTHFPVDKVINTTASLGARLLARLLTPKDAQGGAAIGGFGLDADGFGVSGDMWATFLQGASAERLNCPFNLVDMFRATAGVSAGPPPRGLARPAEDAQAAALAYLKEHAPQGQRGFVAFQLGASEARRQWPVEYFAALGAALWRELHLCPLLLGSPAERPLAEAYAKAVQESGGDAPCVDAIGRTDIPTLAGLLLHSRLLVSNDTGTMHLAAGLGVPVLGIFLSTAQPWDTGPYLPDCCCLEPDMPCHPCPFHQPCSLEGQPCLRRIVPDTVFTLAAHYLTHGEWTQLPQCGARVWLTKEDATGFADLLSLSGHDAEERTSWLRQQRYYYRHILDVGEGSEIAPPSASGLSSEFRQNVLTALRQAGELLLLLEEQAVLVQRMPSAKTGERLLASCNRIRLVLEQCGPLRALGHLWLVLSQEQGGQLDSFVRMAGKLRQSLVLWQETLEKSDTV